ncbi:MAG: hypothetical protein ABSC37_10380, partial [Xanthobacteraceae bacterium]
PLGSVHRATHLHLLRGAQSLARKRLSVRDGAQYAMADRRDLSQSVARACVAPTRIVTNY